MMHPSGTTHPTLVNAKLHPSVMECQFRLVSKVKGVLETDQVGNNLGVAVLGSPEIQNGPSGLID